LVATGVPEGNRAEMTLRMDLPSVLFGGTEWEVPITVVRYENFAQMKAAEETLPVSLLSQ